MVVAGVAVGGVWVPPMSARGRTVACFGWFGILYTCPMFGVSASVDTTPVTGSLHFAAYDCRLDDLLAIGLTLYVSQDSTDCLLVCSGASDCFATWFGYRDGDRWCHAG